MKHFTLLIFLLIGVPSIAFAQHGEISRHKLDSLLTAYRANYDLPALGAAVILGDTLSDIDVVGV